MLKSLLNRLNRVEQALKPRRLETVTVYWYGPRHIEVPKEALEPPAVGVERFYVIEYAPSGVEVDWDPEAGWYPPLEKSEGEGAVFGVSTSVAREAAEG